MRLVTGYSCHPPPELHRDTDNRYLQFYAELRLRDSELGF